MKQTTTHAKSLTSLLKKIGEVEPPQMPDADDPVAVLVQSFLMWEATTDKAVAAYQRLRSACVDFNEMRVCMPYEIAEILGVRYPRADDRCARLRAALRDIYLREHVVALDRLAGLGKRDVKKYIETLDGIAPYVSTRVQLVSFDVHGVPVDEQLRRALVEHGAAHGDAPVAEVAGWLARQVRATDGLQVHFALQALADGTVSVTGKRSAPRRSSGGSKKSSGRSRRKDSGSGRKTSSAKT